MLVAAAAAAATADEDDDEADPAADAADAVLILSSPSPRLMPRLCNCLFVCFSCPLFSLFLIYYLLSSQQLSKRRDVIVSLFFFFFTSSKIRCRMRKVLHNARLLLPLMTSQLFDVLPNDSLTSTVQ